MPAWRISCACACVGSDLRPVCKISVDSGSVGWHFCKSSRSSRMCCPSPLEIPMIGVRSGSMSVSCGNIMRVLPDEMNVSILCFAIYIQSCSTFHLTINPCVGRVVKIIRAHTSSGICLLYYETVGRKCRSALHYMGQERTRLSDCRYLWIREGRAQLQGASRRRGLDIRR